MYAVLMTVHSLMRWLVLAGLLMAIVRSFKGWFAGRTFGRADNTIRHGVATIAHIQLVVGYLLYFTSPLVTYFRSNINTAIHNSDARFFGLIHIIAMTIAVIVVTLGSSLAKRKVGDRAKFKTIAIAFTVALAIIALAIPWPFSPFAKRAWLSLYW
jgi:hypothetical protein